MLEIWHKPNLCQNYVIKSLNKIISYNTTTRAESQSVVGVVNMQSPCSGTEKFEYVKAIDLWSET